MHAPSVWSRLPVHLTLTLLIVVLLATPTLLAAPAAAPVPIRLAAGSFDPLVESAESLLPATLRAAPSRPETPRYFLVQFAGPIHEADKAAARTVGATLLDYIPDFTFVARMTAKEAEQVAALPQVRWVGDYQPGFRLAPDLVDRFLRAGPGLAVADEPLDLYVTLFPGEDLAAARAALTALGAAVTEQSETVWGAKLVLRADAARLADIAALDGISWIEPAAAWVLHNDVAVGNGLIDVSDVWARGYYGTGQIVAIADTQLDTGNPSTSVVDFKEFVTDNPRLTLSQLGTATSDTHGHGTHVAGSVLGNGRLNGATYRGYVGHPAGAAPEATGYFQAIMNTDGSLGGIPANLNNLFTPAQTFGARIHTNSWGSGVFGDYTTSSQEVDQFSWNNRDFLILFAAGNSGRDSDANGVIDIHSINAPATAKNNITVGASENIRPGISTWNQWYSPAAPIFGEDRANNANGLAAFSSRGPTDDGRTKPDIVAPGTLVNSVRSTASAGSGTYVLFSGTSMATPLTAGAAAVARQYFIARETYAPSAAMLKSLLANGATNMAPGQYGTGATQEIPNTRPTNQAGWGRVDLEDTLFPTGSRRTMWWDIASSWSGSLRPLTTGITDTYTFEVQAGTPLNATLAWTDYPGTPAASGGLVNDLDIRLDGPGGPYYAANARQRASSQHLNNITSFTSLQLLVAGHKYAMRLTPTQYPAVPTMAKLWFYSAGGSSGNAIFDLKLYGDNAGGAPGALLCTLAGKRAPWSSAAGFYATTVDLSPCGTTLNSGDFYLSVEFTSVTGTAGRFLMRNVPTGRAWANTAGTWNVDPTYDYGFAAIVYTPVSPATPYDRVNNLVGMDIAAPTTGVYTLTVSGFNVPQGPQPYALTLSGDYRPLGTETVTRTISGPGTYKFGNTGITIEFTSEDVDTVGVTVHRDDHPNATSTNVVKRYYTLTTAGGSGSYTANVTFGYEQAEFAASALGDENQIDAYRWDGSSWTRFPASSRDSSANTITVNGVTAFSTWALGSLSQAPNLVVVSTFAGDAADGLAGWFLPLLGLLALAVGRVIAARRR